MRRFYFWSRARVGSGSRSPFLEAISNISIIGRRLSRLEGQYLVMQSQMIGMQSSLDRILNAIQSAPTGTGSFSGNQQAPPSHPTNYSQQPTDISGFPAPPLTPLSASSNSYYSQQGPSSRGADLNVASRPKFPPLPGFAPPPHKFATYGIVPSTAPSSDDESEETLPRASLNAPIEALQGLANAAAEAAVAPLSSHNRYAAARYPYK